MPIGAPPDEFKRSLALPAPLEEIQTDRGVAAVAEVLADGR